jgi:hypothetical protein
MAMSTVQQRLQQIGASQVTLEVTSQQVPSPTLTLQNSQPMLPLTVGT